MRDIVINTGPIIALVAATGSLDWLSAIYRRVLVPSHVAAEIAAGGDDNPEIRALRSGMDTIQLVGPADSIPLALLHELDPGEASVIHTALEYGIETVAIDEKCGRRIARLNGLKVTGSLGILLKAKSHGVIDNLSNCITLMRHRGIWVSDDLVAETLAAAHET